jgi:hypothetical protein
VSFNVSPLVTLEEDESVNPTILPPILLIAVSKLKRVRVDGSKNSEATTFPSSKLQFGFFSNSAALASTSRISSFV